MNRVYLIILSLIPLSPLWSDSQDYELIENRAKTPLLAPAMQGRSTMKLRLSNGLEAYLVSDPKAEKSSAALSVAVGSWDEPVDKPGLAHFLEHMLFLGTVSYPDENEYDRYISLHGGNSNAFTSNDATAYLFSVDHNALDGALERFAAFFKEPLFNPSGVLRELNAIDQEYSKNLLDDHVRKEHVMKQLTDPNHPESHFHMGNSASLAGVTREELKQWFETHYSAERMRLFLYSALPLDQLREMTISRFRGIPRREVVAKEIKPLLTPASAVGQIAFIEPVQNARSLTLHWELPLRFSREDNRLDKVVCFVMGHEGAHSLLAQLKGEGLATELVCGRYQYGRFHNELQLEIELTEEGLRKYQTVIERVFQAIASWKESGIPERLFDEAKKQALMTYQYQGQREAFEEAFYHSLHLQEEDLTTYPERQELLFDYDARALEAFMRYLTPDHCRIAILAPQAETRVVPTHKEPDLNVGYSIKPVTRQYFTSWMEAQPNPSIALPIPNSFMPEELCLVEESDFVRHEQWPVPQRLSDSESTLIYYASDTLYRLPKVSLLLTIRTPSISPKEPQSSAFADLYVKCLKESLNQTLYSAELAGLSCEMKAAENGIKIGIQGFSDKAAFFLEEISNVLTSVKCDEAHFHLFKDILLRDYADQELDAPIKQAADSLKELLYDAYATPKEKERALRKASLADYLLFVEGLYRENFIEGLIYGNIPQEVIEKSIQQLQKVIGGAPYLRSHHINKRVLLLPDNEGPFYSEESVQVAGNAVLLAIEAGVSTPQKRAVQMIVMRALREAFYHTLRTEQQTGYIVMSSGEELEGELIDLLGVQSHSHDARDLLARFELFLETYVRDLESIILPKERFMVLRDAIAHQLSQPPRDTKEMGELLEKLAFTYHGAFDRIQCTVEALKELNYDTFLKEARSPLERSNRRRLAVILRGNFSEKAPFHYEKIKGRSWLRQQGRFQDKQSL